MAPPARPRLSRWVDPLVGSDPGLFRLRTATLAVAGIALTIGVERAFMAWSHALQLRLPASTAPTATQHVQLVTQHHAVLVVAILLGSVVAMMSATAVHDATLAAQAGTAALMGVAYSAALTAGLAVGGHRLLALAAIAVSVTVGTYLRRFGPRGFASGALLFMGTFMGFFIHPEIAVGDAGWLAADAWIGLVCCFVVRAALFRPDAAKDLRRAQRSWVARSHRLVDLAVEAFDSPGDRDVHRRRLRRQLLRLNESTLMIEAKLARGSVAPASAGVPALHQRLFDQELALTNVARFSLAMGAMTLDDVTRGMVGGLLADLRRENLEAAELGAWQLRRRVEKGCAGTGDNRLSVVIPHRFASSVIDLSVAQREWLALGTRSAEEHPGGAPVDHGSHVPAVELVQGWLPGSANVSARASSTPGRKGPGERIALAPYARAAVQVGVAVTASIALGDVLSARRFYWAVLATFLSFMGTYNAAEQRNKAFYRVLGTAAGILVGSLVVRATGHHTNWSVAVILVALFVGIYLMRINYAFMAMAVTITISQLYVQLDEYSGSLLLLRLEETAIGGAVAMATVLLVLPLRPGRVLRAAATDACQALVTLIAHATILLEQGPPSPAERRALRAEARAVDAAYQALVATAKPVRATTFGDEARKVAALVDLTGAARHYSRNLVADLAGWRPLDQALAPDIGVAGAQLRSSAAALLDRVAKAQDEGGRPFTRSAGLLDRVERAVVADTGIPVPPGTTVLRDLMLLDGTLARLAATYGMEVADHDTTQVASGAAPAARPAGGDAGG